MLCSLLFLFVCLLLGFFWGGVVLGGRGFQSWTFFNENNSFKNWRIQNSSVNPNSTFLTLLQVQKMT